MLNMVEVRNRQGDLLSFPLNDVSEGYIVEDIQGLDPVKATIVSSSFARLDGEQYQSSRRDLRNITFRIRLEPDHVTNSVRSLRNRLYVFFMPKAEIELRFYDTDGLVVNISGRVESFEAPLFTDKPVANISILCLSSDFIELSGVELSGVTTSGSTETLLEYDGTIETGIEFVLTVNRPLSEFTFYHRPPDDALRSMDFSAPLIAGDVLTINTVPGSKGATLNRFAFDTSILYGISPQSNWIELMHGENYIRVYAEGAAIPFDIRYVNRYGGL
jgi:hypothetical protein